MILCKFDKRRRIHDCQILDGLLSYFQDKTSQKSLIFIEKKEKNTRWKRSDSPKRRCDSNQTSNHGLGVTPARQCRFIKNALGARENRHRVKREGLINFGSFLYQTATITAGGEIEDRHRASGEEKTGS